MKRGFFKILISFLGLLALLISCSVGPITLNPGAKNKPNPSISITLPISGTMTNISQISISGVSSVASPATISKILVRLNNESWQLAAGTGIWSNISILSEGSNSLSAMAVSSQGKTNIISNHLVILAYSTPMISVTYPNNNLVTNMENVVFSGTASVNSPETITMVKINLNNGGWQTAVGTNSWSIGLTLDEGTNSYSIMAISGNNKTNTIENRKVIIQFAIPSLAFSNPAANTYTNISGITVLGTSSIGAPETIQTVKVKLNSGVWQLASGTNNWSLALSFSSGTNKISVFSVSSHNKTNLISDRIVIFDNVNPTLTVNYPSANFTILSNHYQVSGTSLDNFGVKAVYYSINSSVFSNFSGILAWNKNLYLNEGANTINTVKVFALDYAGNFSLTNTKTITLNNQLSGFLPNSYGGCSVAISSNEKKIIAGAYKDSSVASEAGAIYWLGYNNANNTQLSPTGLAAGLGLAAGDQFGTSVAISYDRKYSIMSAPFDDDKGIDSGSVFVFSNITQLSKLTASDGAANDLFGSSVSCSSNGKTLVVGSPNDDDKGSESGSIYIYKWGGSSWAETKKTFSSGVANQKLGTDVAISADGNSVVSAGWDAVVLYKWNGSSWVETRMTNVYVSSVAASGNGNTIVSGHPSLDLDASMLFRGAIIIYKWSGSAWQRTLITAPGGYNSDAFGCDVAVSSDGNTIVVGAKNDDDKGTDSGAIYIYKWNGSSWDYTKKSEYGGAAGNWYGSSVAISLDGKTIVVGTPGLGPEVGTVWVVK